MAKQSSTMPLHSKSTPAEREAANRQHHQELITATLDNAVAVGHGHYVGSQGPAGHKMVPSDAALQGEEHAYIPQGALQNKQNTSSDGAGSASGSEPDADDYGRVDK